MDYLRAYFDEELNHEGVVTIAGNPFYRDAILRDLDPTAYDEAFREWFSEKREEKCERANEILALYDNEGRFMRLKEIFLKDSVTPFVGAGLSMPSGYPGWTAFLFRVLAETTVDEDEFRELIDAGKYEEAAEKLFAALPDGCFLEQIENAFGVRRSIDGCIQKLPYLFKSALITTNFDAVLEAVYQRSELQGFEEVLLGGNGLDLPRALGEGRRTLVKLHGSANRSRDRILTKSEYDAHYGAEGQLQSVVEAISTRTLLFLGCSLSVDRTLKSLETLVRERGVENLPKHYAFLRLDNEEERLERRDMLARCNIYPIWYTGDHDECLEALLEKLVEGVDI